MVIHFVATGQIKIGVFTLQLDDAHVAHTLVRQLQADIAELRTSRHPVEFPTDEKLRSLFATKEALQAVAGELQVC